MADAMMRLGRMALALFAIFWFVFLVTPIVVTAIASLTSSSYLVFPPPGFSFQWYVKGLGVHWFWTTLGNSLIIAVVSTAIAVVIGVMAARVLARHRFRGRAAFEYVVLSPLIIPGVVVGFALFTFAILIDFQDAPLINLIVGHTVVTIPFTVRSIWSAMAGAEISLEEAAQSLGATPWVTFWNVTFPMIVPGIVAGAIIAFTFSFNDVTISAFLVAKETRTLPVELMAHIEYVPDPTPAAVSSIMILLTLGFFVLVERTVGIGVFTEK
jgi:putative spermidine/putrescine transport system permease protein